ncbi:hypothetical protein RRG08_040005 [Elysia crispata]|uniref:Uncharacterized protein n=1 Tax=Elysia crispata TaxID=231223 RepID=A0AAE0Z7U3_9GAST|nr:hypothetical protein RRG08_040005 [Elysia crispata]
MKCSTDIKKLADKILVQPTAMKSSTSIKKLADKILVQPQKMKSSIGIKKLSVPALRSLARVDSPRAYHGWEFGSCPSHQSHHEFGSCPSHQSHHYRLSRPD